MQLIVAPVASKLLQIVHLYAFSLEFQNMVKLIFLNCILVTQISDNLIRFFFHRKPSEKNAVNNDTEFKNTVVSELGTSKFKLILPPIIPNQIDLLNISIQL